MDNLFFIDSIRLKWILIFTSRVYFWLELIMSMITSILNWTGLILSEWFLAYFMIILKGFVLFYKI